MGEVLAHVITPAEVNNQPPKGADQIEFAVFSQDDIRKGQLFCLDLWLYHAADRERVLAALKTNADERGAAQVPPIKPGCNVTFYFRPRYLYTEPKALLRKRRPARQQRTWSGQPLLAQMIVLCPENVKFEEILERVELYADGIFIGDCVFKIDFAKHKAYTSRFNLIRSAFASYSSKDRVEVLARLSIFDKLLDIDVFLDVEALRSGENWEERIVEEVSKRDRFLLFWSRNAAKSKWVR